MLYLCVFMDRTFQKLPSCLKLLKPWLQPSRPAGMPPSRSPTSPTITACSTPSKSPTHKRLKKTKQNIQKSEPQRRNNKMFFLQAVTVP